METKAQKAALASIMEKLERSGYHTGSYDGSCFYYSLKEIIEDIEELKTKYSMDNKVFNNVVEKIYDILMRRERYDNAAEFAKKYGL